MNKTILALAFLAGLTLFAESATAGLSFNWNFAVDEGSNVSGTLTLNDAGTHAESVYITSATLTYNPDFNFVNNDIQENSFLLSATGLVENAFLVAFNSDATQGELYFNYVGYNVYTVIDSSSESRVFVANPNGMSGITFTAAVPEPSTYALFGLGAIGMLMVMRRKKTA